MIYCSRSVEGEISAKAAEREVILWGKCCTDLFDDAGIGVGEKAAEMVGSGRLCEDLLDLFAA